MVFLGFITDILYAKLQFKFNPCPAEPGHTLIYPASANSVDPDQLASEEAN